MRALLLLTIMSFVLMADGFEQTTCMTEEVVCAIPVITAYMNINHPSKTTVNDMCRMYDKFLKCISVNQLESLCPHIPVKTGVDVVMGYLCGKGKQEFIDNMECMHDADGNVQPTDYQEPLAAALKGFIIDVTLTNRHLPVATSIHIAKTVMCAMFSFVKRVGTIMDKKCGTDAGDWIRGALQSMYAGLKKLGITANCTKHTEQQTVPVLSRPIAITRGDCSNSSIQSYLNTCLFAGFVNTPVRPLRIPTYAVLVHTLCRGFRLDKCWHPVRKECPAVVNTVYDQVIVTTVSTCSAANTTIHTGCNLVGILENYLTSSMCKTHVGDYIVSFAVALALPHSSHNEIWKFIAGFLSNRGGEWLICLKDGIATALPEIQRTCGTEMRKSLQEFDKQINLLAQYVPELAKTSSKH